MKMKHERPATSKFQFLVYCLCISTLAITQISCSSRQTEMDADEQARVARGIPSAQSPSAQSPSTVHNSGDKVRNMATDAAVEEVVVTGSHVRSGGFVQESRTQALSTAVAERERRLAFDIPTNTENYLPVNENSVNRVVDNPVSTFSIDVDTAAYSNIRRMLSKDGMLPPHDAVRIEEMINYFDYHYERPSSPQQPLSVATEVMASPWNPGNQILMVGIQGYEQLEENRPAANLVFLVDVSGSMQSPDKLGLVKSSLKLLVSRMNSNDRIALVVYAGAAGVVLESTPGNDKLKILTALESLSAGGSTNGGAGIELAYRVAEQHLIEGGINRVIIASDGDMNVGVSSIEALTAMIKDKREKGISLTTLSYGTGNLNYSLMEQLADVGNGNAAYIDTLNEARKVLVEEMQSTLLTIAKDVKIQIEFNPAAVSEYRLIGYENRLLRQEDFRNDKIDAGEIGSGHTVTALYEITPTGSTSALLTDLRYGAATPTSGPDNEIAFVKIRYKLPDQQTSTEFSATVLNKDGDQASENIRFATAIAGFGQLLQGARYTKEWNYPQLLELARNSRGDDEQGYRSELIQLVELASAL